MSRGLCPIPSLPPPHGIPLTVLPEHPCPYLPDRVAMNRAFRCDDLPPQLYHELMDANFRRSGTIFYQPICRGCRECRQIRVPVDQFGASKSQRRVGRRNADLAVEIGKPDPTDEKFDLYMRYLRGRHDPKRDDNRESFEEFLYKSAVDSLEICYRDRAGTLIAAGICDVCEDRYLSSVYFYFNPAESARSLGTFSSLCEIAEAQRRRIPHYYVGYWIRDCAAMSYKSRFQPHQLLQPNGAWETISYAPCIEMPK